MMTIKVKKNSRKSLDIVEDDASGVQVHDTDKWLSKICWKYDRITLHWWFSTKYCDDALK